MNARHQVDSPALRLDLTTVVVAVAGIALLRAEDDWIWIHLFGVYY